MIRFDGGNSNPYGYVVNDPINFVDTNGLIVINNSNVPIAVKPEKSSEPLKVIGPGERYDKKQDGFYTPEGKVYKTADDVDVIYNKDGSVNRRVNPDVVNPIERAKRSAWQWWEGGWKDEEWLKENKGEWPSGKDAKDAIDKWKREHPCP